MEVVPTSTGCFFSCSAAISSATALYFSFTVRKTTSGFSTRSMGLVGGDDDDFELVDLFEFGGFGFGGAGHSAELLIEAEIVLEGDGGEGLVFLADADAFLGFDGLVEAVGPAAPGHEAAGESVDDDDLAVLDHVVHIALVEGVGFDRGFDVVLQVPVFGVGDVVDAQELFDGYPAFVGDADGAVFFIDHVVAGKDFSPSPSWMPNSACRL